MINVKSIRTYQRGFVMNILVSSPILAVLALIGTIGGSLVAVPEFELSLPKPEPVRWTQYVEMQCPGDYDPKQISVCAGKALDKYLETHQGVE